MRLSKILNNIGNPEIWIKTRRNYSRALYLQSPVAHLAIERLVSGVVGTGFRTKLKDLQSMIDSVDCILTPTNKTIQDVIECAIRGYFLDGECFVVHAEGIIDNLDACRISTPNGFSYDAQLNCYINPQTRGRVYDGIEYNEDGIFISGYHVKLYSTGNEYEFIPAENIIHVANNEILGYARGVPILSRIVETISDFHDYEKAELGAAMQQANLSIYVTTNKPDELNFADAFEDSNGEIIEKSMEVDGRKIHKLMPSEDIKTVASTHPYNGFPTFTETVLKLFSAEIGLPFQTFTLDINGTYSSSKAAAIESQKVFKKYQNIIIKHLLEVLFEDSKNTWFVPQLRSLDPVAEYDFYKQAVNDGFVTREEACFALFGHLPSVE